MAGGPGGRGRIYSDMTTIYVRLKLRVSGFRNFPPCWLPGRHSSGGTEEIKTLKTEVKREEASCLKFLNPQNNRSLFLKGSAAAAL